MSPAFSYSGPYKRHALFQSVPHKFYNIDFHMHMDSHYNNLNRDQRTIQPHILHSEGFTGSNQ